MAKVTKRDRFMQVRGILMGEIARGEDVTELVDFVDNEIALIQKRANASKTMTKSQRENVVYKQEIMRVLNSIDAARATEIASEMGVSVQKVTALMRQLVSDGYAVREVDGKVTRFRVNEDKYL